MKKHLFIFATLIGLLATAFPAAAQDLNAPFLERLASKQSAYCADLNYFDKTGKLLYDLFMEQLVNKERQLCAYYKNPVSVSQDVADWPEEAVLYGGLRQIRERKYPPYEIRPMLPQQQLNLIFEKTGKYVEQTEPKAMLDALYAICHNLLPESSAYTNTKSSFLPADETTPFSFEQAYLLVSLLIETDQKLENLP